MTRAPGRAVSRGGPQPEGSAYHLAELQMQLEEARRAEDLEKTNQAAVFRILEPARTPAAPASPNRPRLFLMGLLADAAALECQRTCRTGH